MKRTKFIRFTICTLMLSLGMSIPVASSAATNPNAYSKNMEITSLSQEIEKNIDAELVDENGNPIELEVTSVELVPLTTSRTDSGITTYAATAKVKTSKKSYNKNGIDADGVLTMKWTDGKGANNKITRLQGYWSIAKGTFQSGKIYWGSNYTGPTTAPHKKSVKIKFDEAISYKSESSVTGKLKAHSIATIKSPKNKKKLSIFHKCIAHNF